MQCMKRYGSRLAHFPESIEWFTGDHAFSPWYDLAPPPILLSSQQAAHTGDTQEDWERETACWGRGGGSQILPRCGRLVFFKSCNTLCHCPIRDKPTQFSYLSSQRGGETMILQHIIPSAKFKCRVFTRTLKPNSWTYNFVEISGHNLLESSQTWGFRIQCLHYKPVANNFCLSGGGGWGEKNPL